MAKVEIKKTSGGGGGGGGNVNFTSVTYAQLVTLIGTSGLVQGDSYLITDFQTIYDQPDYDAAGLPKAVVSTLSGATEPIIVEAISTNEISNQALSTVYENDQLLYDWTFQTTEVMSVAAKGRITQRTDNNNNVLPYDFREVLFKRYESVSGSGIYNSYKDTGFASNSAIPTFGTNAYNNSIPFYKNAASPFFLPNNVFGNDCYDNIIENLFYNNTFGNECNANNIGYNFLKNLIGNQFWKNNVGTDFESNIIGNAFRNNKVLNRFAFNTIADNFKQNQIANNFGVNPAGSGSGNTIGSEFNFNVVGEHFHNNQITGSFLNNNVGDIFSNNIIGIRFRDNNISNYFGSNSSFGAFGNTIGDDFKNNQIGETFSSNTVGNDFVFNVLGDECYVNVIGNEFLGNNIGNFFQYNPIIGNYFKHNNIANYFWYNIDIGEGFQNNKIGDYFGQNTTGVWFIDNVIGNGFGTNGSHTNLGNTIGDYFQNNNIGNNFQENIYIANNFQRNYIENDFKTNTIGNSCQDNYIKSNFALNVIDLDFKSNNIADGFVSNNILQDFKKNNIGQNFFSNVILNNFELNVIGNDFYQNADIKNDFKRNNIGNSFYQNVLIDDEFQDNVIGNFFYNNTIAPLFKFNSIGNTFQSNNISNGFEKNSILNNFLGNTIGFAFINNQIGNYFYENTSIGDYFQGNQIGSYFGTDLALSSGLGNTIGYNFASNVIGDFFNQNTVQNDVTNMNIEGYFQSKLILATTNTKTWIGGLTTGFVSNTDGFLESSATISGYVPYTGATADVDLGTYNLTADHITLNTNPSGAGFVEGATQWNNTDGTSETLLKGGNVTLKNGVDLVARVVNKVIPNTTLTKAAYQVVKVSGATGGRLSIELAQADGDPNSADTLGVVTETIATNQEGFIMTVGQLSGINTTGSLQGETWADGDVLYLSPTIAGAMTKVKPTGLTGHIVVLGYVEYAHINQGKIYIKIMNGWEISELHDVYINPATLSNNDVLAYNSATQLWENELISQVITLTTNGTGENSTFVNTTLNIPNYGAVFNFNNFI